MRARGRKDGWMLDLLGLERAAKEEGSGLSSVSSVLPIGEI